MEWKEGVVREVMRPHDAGAILNIRLPTKAAEDFAAWHYEENELYSVHSAY
jgi:hypothetical protein